MKYKFFFLTTISICLIVSLQAQSSNKAVSKVGTVAATFLEIPVGAKSAGMGGAFVSLANDVSALYWNVAGIVNLDRNEIMGIHTRWIGGTNFDYAGLVIPFGESGAFGVSFTSLSMDDMKVRTVEKPEGTGEYFSAGDISIGLSYAFTLTERFAIGFTGKYVQQTIWHMTANAFAVDAGTTFRTDLLNGMVIGASISNFGTQMRMDGRDTRTSGSADETKMGSNQNIPQNTDLDSWDLPLLFQFGISTNAIRTDQFRWTVAVDALHPTDNYESVNIGTEFAFQEFIFLRGGYNAAFLDDSEGGLAFGVGFSTKSLFSNVILKFDFAYQDMNRLENAQFLSVALEF